MRDAIAVQIERISTAWLNDRELNVVFLRPSIGLVVVLVTREMDELDVRIILQRFRVGLSYPRHFRAARRTPRGRKEAEVELGILLEILVEQEVALTEFLSN